MHPGACRQRRLRGGRQPDRGGRQQAAVDTRQGLGQEARFCNGEKEYLTTLDAAAFGAASDVTPEGLGLAKRNELKKAKVAAAHNLAVIMHRMVNGTEILLVS